MTEWRSCVGFSAYEVSDEGNVRRSKPGQRPGRHYPITGHVCAKGYVYVGIVRDTDNKRVNTAVHVLVCSAFHGARPSPEHEVAHWDGDEANNRKQNIRWVTPKGNAEDRRRHGHDRIGEEQPNAKLKDADIPIIMALSKRGVRQREIAKRFGVHQRRIWEVVNNVRWAHVPRSTPLFRETAA